MTDVLLVGSATAEVEVLCEGLSADMVVVPAPRRAPAITTTDAPDWPWAAALDAWRAEACAAPVYPRIVVAVWDEDVGSPAPLATLGLEGWFARHEAPLARWFAAMGVASRRCAGGGAIVAVIERPSPLDCAGWAAETALGDAVESMVRSLARAEGSRNVRVNAVTTPTRLAPEHLVDPAPPLARYPGSVDPDVLGAVRLLLDDGAIGVTGTVVDVDAGRSWR